jgi:hypothetical protein
VLAPGLERVPVPELGLVRELVQGLVRVPVRELVQGLVRVPVRELVQGLHSQQPPVHLALPLPSPKLIYVFYSFSLLKI